MNRAYRLGLLCAASLLLAVVVGCGRPAESSASTTTPTASAPPGETPGPNGKMRGGATISTKAYPAPAGVQTGNYAGGMK